MLNASEAAVPPLNVIDYADAKVADAMQNGRMNTEEEQILANIASSIRRGHSQWRGGPIRQERICLVGSGPSLADTFDELKQLIWEGATLVTMNGAYHYCIERGLRPQTQIVMDARPTNARFLHPEVSRCNYVLASQCAPEVWDAVEGRPHVWIFHAVVKKEGPTSDLLDRFYLGNWLGVGGGCTVATRSINLLRTAGYVRYECFGIDSCVMGNQHHVLPQPENDHDRYAKVAVSLKSDPNREKIFHVSPSHLKQFEDFLVILKINGKHFTLNFHGDGLIAHTIRMLGESDIEDLNYRLSEAD